MANKGLKGNYFIPDNIKDKLQSDISKNLGGKNRRRIIGYLNDGHMTDREISKLLYDYKYNNLGNENDIKIIEKLVKWAQSEIGGKSEHIERTKKSQSDIGLENKHKKTHFKWGDDTKPIQFKNLASVPKPGKMFEKYELIKKILHEGLNIPKMVHQPIPKWRTGYDENVELVSYLENEFPDFHAINYDDPVEIDLYPYDHNEYLDEDQYIGIYISKSNWGDNYIQANFTVGNVIVDRLQVDRYKPTNLNTWIHLWLDDYKHLLKKNII